MAKGKTQEEFDKEIYELTGDEYTFMESYKNTSTKIKIRHNSKHCDYHEYSVKPNVFLTGRRCPKCANINRTFKGVLTNEEWLKRLNKLKHVYNGEFSVITERGISSRTNIKVKHNKCGKIINVNCSEFFRGSKCKECSHEDTTKKFTKTKYDFEKEVHDLVGSEYSFLDEYKNTYISLKVLHSKCQSVYKVAPRDFLKGLRCPICSSSRGEKSIVEYFINNNIKYENQKTYPNLFYIRSLYYDFYLPDYDILIEYNGKQHYEPIEFFGGQGTFETQVKRDNIKRKYAEENKIRLIEIPYTYKTTKHIEKLLDKLI